MSLMAPMLSQNPPGAERQLRVDAHIISEAGVLRGWRGGRNAHLVSAPLCLRGQPTSPSQTGLRTQWL